MRGTIGLGDEGARETNDDEAAEIRYSLTALGEAVLAERKGTRFRGFGPCPAATLQGTA